MRDVVLDSSALLAHLQGEPAGARVREALATARSTGRSLLINMVSVGEVYYLTVRRRGIEAAETFLRQERGDCDDYAVLADYVLRRHNQETRIIHVRMVGRVAHAVCYVAGSKVYLDFNNRNFFINLQRCGGTLREIATKVADSFKANWTSVSEFTYTYEEDTKHFGVTVVKTDPSAKDPDLNPAAVKSPAK